MTTLEFNAQVSGLQDTLLGYTRKFTSDYDDAHDLVQETILKALSQKNKFIHNSNIKGWLFTIMRNTFINKYRREYKSKTSISNTLDYSYSSASENHTFNLPYETLKYQEIEKAVARLGKKYRTPLQMFIDGFKYSEIAEKLNLPLGTVKVRIFHARKVLKVNLQEHLNA